MPERDILLAKRGFLELRSRVTESIRGHFRQAGFLEVQTPLRTPAPAPEQNIEAVPAGDGFYLITSPELYLKRLLAAGYDKIFQITPVFRSGEKGRLHHPEFTLLEWYRLRANYKDLQRDCVELMRGVCANEGKPAGRTFRGSRIELESPWESVTVREAFLRYAGWDPVAKFDRDRFDLDLVTKVEPHLGFPSPCFLEDYPPSQAALARVKDSDPPVAERFELYWAGVELANGFTELTDPVEQRKRFEVVLAERHRAGLPSRPMPEAFLACLEHLPPCAGIALGMDRLVMLLAGAESIDQVVAFPPDLL
jgi:elongation factor P--(R)-beta-lysine ligase